MGAAPSPRFVPASGQPESAPNKISTTANASGIVPIKATSPDTTYCHYLGSLITTLDRVARMPKLLAATVNKKDADDITAMRSGIQAISFISSMKNIFAPRLMILTVLFYYAGSVAAFDDNWGMPQYKLEPMEQTIDQVTAGCKFDFQPMSSVLQDATMAFYASTEDWANFEGVDLVPENNHMFPNPRFKNLALKKERSILAADCEVDNEDGSSWSIQRIGPFKSTGNYDWWQFAWADLHGRGGRAGYGARFPSNPHTSCAYQSGGKGCISS